MFNLVAINLKDEHGALPHCSHGKCSNPARYQFFPPQSVGDLPDWQGEAVCSRHLLEEARHRPEIVLSLLDILIDELEAKHVLVAPAAPNGERGRIVPMPRH